MLRLGYVSMYSFFKEEEDTINSDTINMRIKPHDFFSHDFELDNADVDIRKNNTKNNKILTIYDPVTAVVVDENTANYPPTPAVITKTHNFLAPLKMDKKIVSHIECF